MVEKSKDIDQANVILIDDKLLAALQVTPWKRYKKQKIESEWQKKLEKINYIKRKKYIIQVSFQVGT